VRVYRGHYYHGVPYYVYVPPYYYAPQYYRWLYAAWPRPVYYAWGWYRSAWYSPYVYYFAPYPAYFNAAPWLTDYVLAENLRLTYEDHPVDAYRPAENEAGVVLAGYQAAVQMKSEQSESGLAVLTLAVKQMIADEVKTVIADEDRVASSSSAFSRTNSGDELPAALDSDHRVFVVFSLLEVTANGESCSLTSSDVIERMENTLGRDNAVAVKILASKEPDCPIGLPVRIQLTDLNEMHNRLREQVDAGIKILSERQGKDGLPAAPLPNPRAVPEGLAAPDATAAAELRKQEHEADQTEEEVQRETSPDSRAAN
jgi:hypothetical protein